MGNYIEVVSTDVADTIALFEATHGLVFGAAKPDLGHARAAVLDDGSLLGVRAPLAPHDDPITRVYLGVDDITAAVTAAEKAGAVLAYGPVEQGGSGTFAIVIHAGAQLGYWQPPVV
jgi:predicted enzyme related to lactoylglutathione lyase